VSTPRWQPVATLLLALFGLGVSVYLTITHFDKVAKVTTSPQSVIFGIPVAMLGLVYFVPMVLLCLPAAWRSPDRRVHLARLGLAVVGVGMILYLLIAELFLIKAICLWCSSVHVVTFLLFVIIVTASPMVLTSDQALAGAAHGPSSGRD
jgi:uncharacterized membrane protein